MNDATDWSSDVQEEWVLVVDDEPTVTTAVRLALETINLRTVTAYNLAEATRLLETEPAVIIIDKNLPDGSGIDLLATIGERWPMAESIIFTGYASLDSAIEALRAGARDYLLKPLQHVDELVLKVEHALEHRRLRMERQHTLEELEEAQRLQAYANHSQGMALLGKLMASLVHEISTPMTVMRGNLDLLAHELPPEKRATVLMDVRAAADQMVDLLTDVRRLSAATGGGQRETEVVALKDLIDRAMTLSKGATRSRTSIDIDCEPGLEIVATPVRLTQVLINLLVNAAEAMDNTAGKIGRVEIRASRRGDRVVVEVEDDGRGIPEDLQGQVFEAFVTSKSGEAASGLGLALSREIVAEHDGTLNFRSTPGEGTCFVIDLPAVED